MRWSRRQLLIHGLAYGVGLVHLTGRSRAESPTALAVVVAANSSVEALSLFQLKRLYLGDRTLTPSGEHLIALNRGASTAERIGFDHSVLGMTPEQVARYWIDRRIRGQSGAPKAVDPARVLLRILLRVPGTIGYVRLDQVSEQVKIVRISGQSPGDPGYPITEAVSAPVSSILPQER